MTLPPVIWIQKCVRFRKTRFLAVVREPSGILVVSREPSGGSFNQSTPDPSPSRTLEAKKVSIYW